MCVTIWPINVVCQLRIVCFLAYIAELWITLDEWGDCSGPIVALLLLYQHAKPELVFSFSRAEMIFIVL